MAIKKIELNLAQMALLKAKQQYKVFEGGRGIGKSTIIAKEMIDVVESMPRSLNVLVGASYMQILTRTLPSTIHGLELFGYKKGVHFTVGEKGPKHWPEPFFPPGSYKHTIHFYTGAVYQMVSQDRPGSGRGMNVDSVTGDETLLLEYESLYNDVLLTNRGNFDLFGKCRKHHSVLFTSTTPMDARGRWMFDYQKRSLSQPEKYYYLVATARYNLKRLGKDYFIEARRNAPSEMHYNAEIESIRPPSIANGFYPTLTKDNYYTKYNQTYLDDHDINTGDLSVDCRVDGDLNPNLPLILGFDWGTFNSLVVAQQDGTTLRFIKCFWAKNPRILDDLIKDDFIPYYRYHKTKSIHMYYDRNGNNRRPASRTTLAEHAQGMLEKASYSVARRTRGLDAGHQEKYHLISRGFKGEDPRLPKLLINKSNCKDLVVSLENAEARLSAGQVKKDKRSEARTTIKQQHATHLSDAMDVIAYPILRAHEKQVGEFQDIRTA